MVLWDKTQYLMTRLEAAYFLRLQGSRRTSWYNTLLYIWKQRGSVKVEAIGSFPI